MQSTVEFSGPQDLRIDGLGATLDGSGIAAGPAFLVTGGGDLAVNLLTVRNAPGQGLAVEVPGSATGTIRVSLFGVAILDNAGHGILVNDQLDPLSLDPTGSDASVEVAVIASRFTGNGFSVSDRDGLRVNEGGDDDFTGGGDLVVTMIGIKTNGNLAGDAGLKIREKGVGNLDVTVKAVEASNNATRGIQIREDDQGNLVSSVAKATALANGDHGIDFDENRAAAGDPGDLTAVVANSNSSNNLGAGVRADQQTPGTGTLLLSKVTTTGNAGGDTAGNVTPTIVP